MLRLGGFDSAVKCIVSDGDWLYAGCDDGNVYDLTGKLSFVAYQIDSIVNIYGLDIADGKIGVYCGYAKGVTMYDWEDGSKLWHAKTGLHL